MANVQAEVATFRHLVNELVRQPPAGYRVEAPITDALVIRSTKDTGSRIGFTLLGSVHGNEVIGVYVLTRILELLRTSVITPPTSCAFILGNPEAVLAGKRFLDYDLNRSFGSSKPGTHEAARAADIQSILMRTDHLLDLHQTRERAERPFFIFPYTKSSLAYAVAIETTLPIVTHWHGGFSADGQCSDEFVNRNGGTGVTVELGQGVYDPEQAGLGLSLALNGLRAAKLGFGHHPLPEDIDLYTVDQIIKRASPEDALVSGWTNFAFIKQGTLLGHGAGQAPIKAQNDGWILFPKYPVANDPKAQTAAELGRLVRQIKIRDLPV